jgi:hypothetical protein
MIVDGLGQACPVLECCCVRGRAVNGLGRSLAGPHCFELLAYEAGQSRLAGWGDRENESHCEE